MSACVIWFASFFFFVHFTVCLTTIEEINDQEDVGGDWDPTFFRQPGGNTVFNQLGRYAPTPPSPHPPPSLHPISPIPAASPIFTFMFPFSHSCYYFLFSLRCLCITWARETAREREWKSELKRESGKTATRWLALRCHSRSLSPFQSPPPIPPQLGACFYYFGECAKK